MNVCVCVCVCLNVCYSVALLFVYGSKDPPTDPCIQNKHTIQVSGPPSSPGSGDATDWQITACYTLAQPHQLNQALLFKPSQSLPLNPPHAPCRVTQDWPHLYANGGAPSHIPGSTSFSASPLDGPLQPDRKSVV